MADIGWQEAVTRLAGEKTRAEMAVAALKKHGSEAAITRGAMAYGDAKAEIDAVIAGLDTALAEGRKPKSLPDLEARLRRGVEAREAFCNDVVSLVPPTKGSKAAFGDLTGLGKFFSSLVDAVKELAMRWADEDALKRQTIQGRLEGAQWREFAEIPPLD